jgi:phospholipid/cholesterol/gamma-HCH transport system substrate-binding protein
LWQQVGAVISFRERRAWLVGLISMTLLGIAVFGAFSVSHFPGLRGVYSLSADLRDAAGLQPGNEVRVAGVKVGKITGIELTSHAARVTMEIQRDIRVPQETRVVVKLKTLLGQKFIDLEMDRSFLEASAAGHPSSATAGYLDPGDVIPRSQTSVPYEIYEAANEGTATLEQIDKRSLRRLLQVSAKTIGVSQDELRRALSSVNDAGVVLSAKGPELHDLLANARDLTSTIAASDGDLSGILSHSAALLTVVAERRNELSALLRATNHLGSDLGLLIRAARGNIYAGFGDLNTILTTTNASLGDIDAALAQLGTAQEMFGQQLAFGRFIEGNVCAVTSEDTCNASGSPEDPGLPIHGIQPTPSGGPYPESSR